MYQPGKEKHADPNSIPSARKIRRACSKELYRTIKRLKVWIPPEQVLQAEELYYKKVILNLPFIVENGSNRKLLADWFEENAASDIAKLWNLEPGAVASAFRNAFGG
ncbi:dehydrogenase [Paenibacillus sp. CC-CFT747]|nr:dehydrogenase [Paenibacillus sp. CC-CFT747]